MFHAGFVVLVFAVMGELSGNWVQQVSVDTSLFVNRKEEMTVLLRQLRDEHRSRAADSGKLIVGVTGRRGVGKSIFTRECIRRFVEEFPDSTAALMPEARLVSYPEFIRNFATSLVDALARFHSADKGNGIARLCAELESLARATKVSESQLTQTANKFGVNAGIEGGLAGVLQSKNALSWEQQRTSGDTRGRELSVTTEMIELSIDAVMQYVRSATPITVIVFFDDLDQLHTDDMRLALKNVIRIGQCIRVVHFRSDAFFEDVRREVDTWIELGPMDSVALHGMLDQRIERYAYAEDRITLRSEPIASALERLCRVTGNPLTLLRWVYQFVYLWEPGALGRWSTDESLLKVVRASSAPGVDTPLLLALAKAAEECPRIGGDAVSREELAKVLGEAGFLDAQRGGLIGRRDREQEALGYWITSSIDLLRPSVKTILRA
jgi:AAA ATPase domain